MNSLVKTLKEQTQSLKKQYIEKTEEWAKAQLQRNIERRNQYHKMTCRETTKERHPDFILVDKQTYYKEQKFFWNKPSYYFTPEFVERMKTDAEKHYEDSIVKLAMRIESKGLNQSKLSVKTSHVGVNIDTVLTDGEKTVRAFTIIAEGPIQRPHYRYLIK